MAGKPTPFDDLVRVMARLRGPDGCPWDREQTLETLRAYLLEETYELLEAIDSGDPDMIREELGDVLLEVVFLAQVCAEKGLFDVQDAARGIRDKLLRRHPHVFGDVTAHDAKGAIRHWEEIKNRERAEAGEDRSFLAGVPRSLPALLRAHRLSSKASTIGFDWSGIEAVHEKLDEELRELRQASREGDGDAVEEELGDLLFITANLGRHSGVDPEAALQRANRKFIRRFRYMEERLHQKGTDPGKASAAELESLWEEAKQEEKNEPGPRDT